LEERLNKGSLRCGGDDNLAMNITDLTISKAHALLKDKKLSVKELTEASLARIKTVDEKVHAFLKVTEKKALEQAQAAQIRFDTGTDVNPLLGIPMSHKDIYCTKGVETTAGSNILKEYIPPYSATVVKKLEAVGAVMVGKTNLDAFAHGASTENSDFGPSKNPFDTSLVPGGSSGGSAVSVASSEVLFSTGTDTGGSIRLPASFTNTVGLKPTYGRVSRYGIIAMASSTDSPGPITKTVEDCALVLSAMAGHDKKDATSSGRLVPDYKTFLGKNIAGFKIGVPKQFFVEGLSKDVEGPVRDAIKKFEELGAKVEEVDLSYMDYALAIYYIIIPSEVSSNLSRYDGIKYGFSVERDAKFKVTDLLSVYGKSRDIGFGQEAKRRIILGTYALSSGYYDAYYKKAQKVSQLIKNDFTKVFEKYDLLLGPVSPTLPFKLGEKSGDPMQMYLADVYTTSMSLAGIPAISVPAGFTRGLPVGLQIIASHFEEGRLLQAAYAFEQATGFFETKPKL